MDFEKTMLFWIVNLLCIVHLLDNFFASVGHAELVNLSLFGVMV